MADKIKVEFYKSSGPGGQRKNKKRTAVRVVDTATGITAIATESRKQADNRVVALERLNSRIAAAKHVPRIRKKTRKPGAVKKRIIESKRRHGEKKRLRMPVHGDNAE
ncbi:MAG: peptide chain release factor-like protein [Elusimicrobiota bacterium]